MKLLGKNDLQNPLKTFSKEIPNGIHGLLLDTV